MPDCRGVGESRIYSKRAKKSPFAGFVPQSGITDQRPEWKMKLSNNKLERYTHDCTFYNSKKTKGDKKKSLSESQNWSSIFIILEEAL